MERKRLDWVHDIALTCRGMDSSGIDRCDGTKKPVEDIARSFITTFVEGFYIWLLNRLLGILEGSWSAGPWMM